MANYEAAIEAQLDGATVRRPPLVCFDFRSGPFRVWPGFSDISADGYLWRGIGALGSISQVTTSFAGVVDEVTLTLAASEEMLEHFSEDAEEATGRTVRIYEQFCETRKQDSAGNWVDWNPISDPLSRFKGIMGPLQFEQPKKDVNGRVMRTLSVIASNAFYNRAKPANAMFSDVDQKARHPGDNIFVNSSLTVLTVYWPSFS